MTKAEIKAFEAGKTAEQRIGSKPMCCDPIMNSMIIEARSEHGKNYNKRIMNAWMRGRGWKQLCTNE